ncbi:MAG: sugar phosphate isomerase/epimerase [bacterium]|nr:sugar phosphate isomerase/epimerase [bacterium]MCM1374750.1 sugar phosphate isomerase/epimerase [Muribaculum sp.]
MAEILCSTGALIGKANNRDYHLLQRLAGQLDCDGYEFMMYSSWYEEWEAMADYLVGLGLHMPVVHCDKRIGEAVSQGEDLSLADSGAAAKFRINCELARRIGARALVLHLWGGMASDQHFEYHLRAYPILRDIAEGYGRKLLVENVVCNKENPLKHLCQLAEAYPEVGFVWDTKMAAFHQEETLLYRQEYAWLWQRGHIRHYHVNDYSGGYMDWSTMGKAVGPIGVGHIDFDAFFRFLRHTGYDGSYTVEATAFAKDGSVDVAMLNRCFERIRQGIAG